MAGDRPDSDLQEMVGLYAGHHAFESGRQPGLDRAARGLQSRPGFSPWSQPGHEVKPSFSLQSDWIKLPEGFGFRMVNNIAEDSKGRIYFSHRGRHPIVRFDKNGRFLGSVGDSEIAPSVNYDLTKNPPTSNGRAYWLHGMHVDPW